MSIDTWKQKYYPVEPSDKMTKRQAVEHSILKWSGLSPSVLKKYGLVKVGRFIEDDIKNVLEISSNSCALCVKYLDRKHTEKLLGCATCPLAKHLGNPCDRSGNGNRPYSRWNMTGNPRPMIKALKDTLKEMEI